MRSPTPKRDVLRTSIELHEAEEKVARLEAELKAARAPLERELAEARRELQWKALNAKAARALLASSRLIIGVVPAAARFVPPLPTIAVGERRRRSPV